MINFITSIYMIKSESLILERVRGIEPLAPVWKTGVLPLYDTRTVFFDLYEIGRGAEIRTRAKRSQSAYAAITPHPAFLIIS